MNDDYYDCPMWGCTISLRADELRAHIEFQHNLSGVRLHRKIQEVLDDE